MVVDVYVKWIKIFVGDVRKSWFKWWWYIEVFEVLEIMGFYGCDILGLMFGLFLSLMKMFVDCV